MAQRVSCPQCSKTFSKREHLNRHRLSHTGERPFQCQICSKPFSRRDVLLRHQRGHFELASSPSNTNGARLNRKRALRGELAEVSGYEMSEEVPGYAAAQSSRQRPLLVVSHDQVHWTCHHQIIHMSPAEDCRTIYL
ncbi:hypothetical protein BDV30DRAFT_155973 [Aspergillus minisclerotigenes]|uniref:C2H2-type domain-containing protein n=1 Tax=Aspergillus minisclerotigenes TaxID=656917 RepID=A0A5N6JGX4_9EURO|nr:hypothetical protein BDV30DRAFT_155973 [Aspergillus minisclerotigenes]